MNNSFRFFENKDCRFYPCHEGMEEINCLFCYCPFFFLRDCPGTPRITEKDGKKIRVCTDCAFPHRPENYPEMIRLLKDAMKNEG
ncbi:MAG: metal-binding protein [Lachnospiraceae bacterium]|nr:metal-binding protein [Lachnospiraceae bacterium]